MSSESELRDAMRSSADIPTTGIDTESVLRRVRARRISKKFAVSSMSVLAIAGVATLGVATLPSLQTGHGGASTAQMMASAPESSQGDANGGSQKLFNARLNDGNLCGMPTQRPERNSASKNGSTPESTGLTLSVSFPTSAPARGNDVRGTVTLTNSGTTHVSGTTGSIPVITVSRDGVTVWHTNGPSITQVTPIELDPGQSHSYEAVFTPIECGPQDEPDQFRENLPPLANGIYEVSAQLLFISNSDVPGGSVLVSGPPTSIGLR